MAVLPRADAQPVIEPASKNGFWIGQRRFSGSLWGRRRRVERRLLLLSGGLIIFLSGALLYVFTQVLPNMQTGALFASSEPAQPEPAPEEPKPQVATFGPAVAEASTVQGPQFVKVLVVKKRIEEGQKLSDDALDEVPMEATYLPNDVLYPGDRYRVSRFYALEPMSPNTPLTQRAISEEEPLSAVRIPPGYRAITVMIDPQYGMDGMVRKDSRVDVLWIYEDNGRREISTIVPFAKVVSGTRSGANAEGVKNGSVTLLVTKKEAQIIELARNNGSISLSLVGDEETPRATEDDVGAALSINDIRKPRDDEAAADVIGSMTTMDPATGLPVTFVLDRTKRRWKVGEQSINAKREWLRAQFDRNVNRLPAQHGVVTVRE